MIRTVFPTPAPPNKANLPSAEERRQEVNYLNAGNKHFEFGGLILKRRRMTMNGYLWSDTTAPSLSTGSPMTFKTLPSVPGPTGTVIGPPESTAFIPRISPSGWFHGDAPATALAEMLLHFNRDAYWRRNLEPSLTILNA